MVVMNWGEVRGKDPYSGQAELPEIDGRKVSVEGSDTEIAEVVGQVA